MLKRVSVIGLGKLGSPVVASFASKGYEVIGLDVNAAFVEALAEHRAPVRETGLQELIDENRERIHATTSWKEAVMESDVSFVIVPTPSEEDGSFSNKFVLEACKNIGEVLKDKKDFHLVVVISTVMPMASEQHIIPMLEKASGKKCGVDFGYCYGPTLIALGSVIRDFLNPDLIMIGESDPHSGDLLEAFYRTVMGDKPGIHRVSPAEAELAKISLNTYITMKISYANMIGMIADAMDIRVDAVTNIIGSDSRVGKKYLRAGGSYGGPCFPRDNRALARAAELVGIETHLPQATDRTNTQQIHEAVRRVLKEMENDTESKVGIFGVSYKPDTDVVEEAMGVRLAHLLKEKGISLVVYDPHALHSARKIFGDTVAYAESIEDLLGQSRVIVITNPYKELASRMPAELLTGKVIIDPWRVMG